MKEQQTQRPEDDAKAVETVMLIDKSLNMLEWLTLAKQYLGGDESEK